jgi:TetR/AcrR family transcriptional regulator
MDNRTAILDIALDLFSRKGYEAVGVQEIVDAAELTKPTLYHYFGSKLGLLRAVLERDFALLETELESPRTYQHDLPKTLEDVARAYFTFAGKRPSFYRMQLSMQFAPPDSEPHQAVQPFNLQQHQNLSRLFEEAALDHGNMRNRQQIYAVTFLGMVNTYIALALNGQITLDEPMIYRATHQFMHGILS